MIYAFYELIHKNNYPWIVEIITDSIKYRTRIIIRLQETRSYALSREIPQPTKIGKAPQSAPKRLLL